MRPKERDAVKNEIFKTGAGSIGDYEKCAFEIPGTGQFCPIGGASPHIGSLERTPKSEGIESGNLCLEEQVGPLSRP